MSIRKRNRKTSNRRDGSTVTLPTPAPVTITPIAGGVNLNVAEGLLANAPDANAHPVDGITLNNSAGTFSNGDLIVNPVDQFNVTLTHPDLLPGTFSGTITIDGGMTGLRSARGGTLVIPDKIFP